MGLTVTLSIMLCIASHVYCYAKCHILCYAVSSYAELHCAESCIFYAEHGYAKCRYAECHRTECRGTLIIAILFTYGILCLICNHSFL